MVQTHRSSIRKGYPGLCAHLSTAICQLCFPPQIRFRLGPVSWTLLALGWACTTCVSRRYEGRSEHVLVDRDVDEVVSRGFLRTFGYRDAISS